MYPTRSCRKNIGPGELIVINTVTKKVAVASKGRAQEQNTTSIARFQAGSFWVPREDFVGNELARGDAIFQDVQIGATSAMEQIPFTR
jgi:hypothetical protein